MTTSRTAQLRAAQFWEKLASLIDTPQIKTLQWAEDGKSVLVNCRHFEEEQSCNKELKKFRNLDALQGFLCSHGFNIITRSTEVHTFQHPDFSIKGLTTRPKRGSQSVCSPQQEEHLKKRKGSNVLTESPPDLYCLPVKKRNARSLYQYINCIDPVLQSILHWDAAAGTAETSSAPVLTHADPEFSDFSNTSK